VISSSSRANRTMRCPTPRYADAPVGLGEMGGDLCGGQAFSVKRHEDLVHPAVAQASVDIDTTTLILRAIRTLGYTALGEKGELVFLAELVFLWGVGPLGVLGVGRFLRSGRRGPRGLTRSAGQFDYAAWFAAG
jgi:hypothetical protein